MTITFLIAAAIITFLIYYSAVRSSTGDHKELMRVYKVNPDLAALHLFLCLVTTAMLFLALYTINKDWWGL